MISDSIYLSLTREFNQGRLRCIITSGQAVVLHRLAIMSKDGDWIVREEREAVEHVLRVLTRHGAQYRFGAPLDIRWLAGGWSSHFEFRHGDVRIRTDFFSRPPRIAPEALPRLWQEQEGRQPPFVNIRDLADIKKTNREKDYAVIGELARLMPEPADQLLYSRSARDLIELAAQHRELAAALAARRPLLRAIPEGPDRLAEALDAERRALIRANEERLSRFMTAAEAWGDAWPSLSRRVEPLPLPQAHEILVREAEGLLPFTAEARP